MENDKHTPGPWAHGGSLIASGHTPVARVLYRFPDGIESNDYDRDAPASFAESDANRRLISSAPDLLDALRASKCPHWVHNAALTTDIEALRRIALWYADWNNNVRVPAIAKATGEA